MTKPKDKGINPKLEEHINKLMKEVMSDKDASITDKMKVIDRALKLEALKQKMDDSSFGTGFHDESEDD